MRDVVSQKRVHAGGSLDMISQICRRVLHKLGYHIERYNLFPNLCLSVPQYFSHLFPVHFLFFFLIVILFENVICMQLVVNLFYSIAPAFIESLAAF